MTRSLVLGGAVCALAWASAVPVVAGIPADGGFFLDTPRGAWHTVLVVSLLAVAGIVVVGLARQEPGRPWRPGPWLAAAGAVGGIAWGATLRGFMAMVAGPESAVTWLGTFGFLLLPCAVAGGLLGYAEHRRRRDLPRRRLALAPLVLAVDPSALLLVAPALAGGWALAGRGTPRRRRLAWAAMVVPVVAYPVIVAAVGDLGLLLTVDGAVETVVLFSCLGVLTLACSIPFRAAPQAGGTTVRRRGAGLISAP